MNEPELTTRAFAAWYRSGQVDCPNNTSGVRYFNGKGYVVIDVGVETRAVYRILNTGRLKRLRRWPSNMAVG